TFAVPVAASPGASFARFRFSTQAGLSYIGLAPDGEVEDYAVTIAEPLDFGDAPDPTYPTLLASNAARHVIVPGFFLGATVDAELNGQPNASATGDDIAGVPDDEDGVTFTTPLVPGSPAGVQVIASAPGLLNAWVDFNANGSWADPGEQIFVNQPLVPGPNALGFPVPAGAALGMTFARFRFSNLAGLSFFGLAPDGEVEDYQVGIAAATIGDLVWEDRNGNGIQDGGEPGIPNVTVNLRDVVGAIVATTTTNALGQYSFTAPPGTYTVEFVKPAGYTFTLQDQGGNDNLDSDPNPATGQTASFAVVSGQTKNDMDAGLYQPAAIGDYVWYDTNADATQDVGEPGIGNVTVMLIKDTGNGVLDPGDTRLMTVTTDVDGGYLFDNLAPSVYFVDVTDAYGILTPYTHTVGAQSQTDPTPAISVVSADIYRDADFGYYRLPPADSAVIGDRVWLDGDGDGVQDPGEPGIGGAQVCATPVAGGAAICATTDPNGMYHITVPAGTYTVTTPTPSGLSPSTPTSLNVSVAPGDQYDDADFGFTSGATLLGTIGNLVWEDLNNNGVVDVGEPGIPGVSVNLIRDLNGNAAWDAGEPITATTTTTTT
ncbi:MAG: hypothetical protein FJ011_28525, partial [Chloroflexi bacterium]|nr:hypothetical protein [Chloroflexota bacterium]